MTINVMAIMRKLKKIMRRERAGFCQDSFLSGFDVLSDEIVVSSLCWVKVVFSFVFSIKNGSLLV